MSEHQQDKYRTASRVQDQGQGNQGTTTSFWVSIILGVMLAFSGVMNLVLFGLLIGSFGGSSEQVSEGEYKEATVRGSGDEKILLLPIRGIITSSNGDGGMSEQRATPARVKQQLKQAREDQSVKAIVLQVNSPGGGVTASDRIWHLLKRFKDKRPSVPVVALMGDIAASGGYYVSAAADRIMAHRTTITGSLGVIMQYLVFEDLLKEKLGVHPETITPEEADLKEMGSPFKELTDREQKIFQGIIKEMYNRFVEVIHKGREALTEQEVRKLADGRIYSASQAKQNKLIDKLGYFQDAIDEAKKMADISGSPHIVRYKKPFRFSDFLSEIAGAYSSKGRIISQVQSVFRRANPPTFLYLWTGKESIHLGRNK